MQRSGEREAGSLSSGEIIPCNQFYDYRAKYLDDRSQLIIPAQLDRELVERVQELAIKAFQAVNASGLARVDFFVEPEPALWS